MKDCFAGGLNIYRTMTHHPNLLRAWAPMRQHLVKDTALGPECSEVVILCVSPFVSVKAMSGTITTTERHGSVFPPNASPRIGHAGG